jgi:Protein of unknown function (DUF3040)
VYRDQTPEQAGGNGVVVMGISDQESRTLGVIEDWLAGSDPRLASKLAIFSRLASGEEMPGPEKIRTRLLHLRLGWQPVMLSMWLIVSAGLLVLCAGLQHR